MKYVLLIYHDETTWNDQNEAEHQQIYDEYRSLIQRLQSSGKYLGGDQLQPRATASVIRVRDGKPLVTDGPFAETREQIGGFFLIDVSNIDEAVSVAGQIPSARTGAIEIRPVVAAVRANGE